MSLFSQLAGAAGVVIYAFAAGSLLYFLTARFLGIRLTDEQQRRGADLSIHHIGANPEGEI